MSFADDMRAEAGLFQEQFGEPLTLFPAEGPKVEVALALIDRSPDAVDQGGDGRAAARTAHVRISAADLAATSDRLRAAFDGCAWDLRPLNSAAPPDGWWRFEATRREAIERTAGGYRRGTRG